jgi:hypothetical protein
VAVRILVSNNSGKEARALANAFPTRIGHLYSPGAFRGPFAEFPYAIDNGAFPAWSRGEAFDADAFRRLLDRVSRAPIAPLWVAVPDVVANREQTLDAWRAWRVEVAAYGWPLAFVVQDGMTAGDVPPDAAVVFVGGSTRWKWDTVAMWCAAFPRVHVGRVNMERLLWQIHRAGAESCDGTGWFRGDRSQLDGLWYYLADSAGLEDDPAHGATQLRLFTSPRVVAGCEVAPE